MCDKADCINWDSDMWGGHCMCLEPPCMDRAEWPDEHGIPTRTKEENKRVQIAFTKDRLSAIDAYADSLGKSRSDFVNLALTEYFHEHSADLEIALVKRAYGM